MKLSSQNAITILDIGKTFAKLTLWSPAGKKIAGVRRANAQATAPGGYPCLDVAGIETWLADTLALFSQKARIGAIIPVAHGAGAVVVNPDGAFVPPLDYEAPLPDGLLTEYRALRDPFALTGSPALPAGLNLGAQLFWTQKMFPEDIARGTIVTWPQFWAWRLTGVAAVEKTSLGCHTDLWLPVQGTFSPLAERQGWTARMAPVRGAGEVLGAVTEEWQKRCGLSSACEVYCGLHDSNADLLAVRGYDEIGQREHTVLSTGTWFIAMRKAADGKIDMGTIAENRDCLVNVDAYGAPTPSARFMGGREVELIEQAEIRQLDTAAVAAALLEAGRQAIEANRFVLPAIQPGVGPFPDRRSQWIDKPQTQVARRAVASLYLALMADESLNLIRSKDRLIVEGRFADDPLFVRALAQLRPAQTIYLAAAGDSVATGALRLRHSGLRPEGTLTKVEPLDFDLTDYASRWRTSVKK